MTKPTLVVLGEPPYLYPFCEYGFGKEVCVVTSEPRHIYHNLKNLPKGSLIVFTGGEDVNPLLYGTNVKDPRTYSSFERDAGDLYAWQCVKPLLKAGHVKVVGVCRGSQFLAVMHGHKLIQHTGPWTGTFEVEPLGGARKLFKPKVARTHHQALSLQGMRFRYLSATSVCCSDPTLVMSYEHTEYDLMGMQWHPEYYWMPKSGLEFTHYLLERIMQ